MKKLISLLSLLALVAICTFVVKNAVSYSDGKISNFEDNANSVSIASNEDAASDKYTGIWTGDDCTLEIGKKDSGYFCRIRYNRDSNAATEWFYSLDLGDVEGKFICSNGIKSESITSNSDKEEFRATEYTDGSCTLLTFGDKILWIDEKEHFGDDKTLVKSV